MSSSNLPSGNLEVAILHDVIEEDALPKLSDGTVFLLNVLKNWNDDNYKLLFADYIEEKLNQPERANLIRVQCELANWDSDNPKPRAYGNWYVDCRNIKPKSEAGSDTVCCAPKLNGQETLCEYHQLKEYQRELLKKPQLIVGNTIMTIMPDGTTLFTDYSNNNFGVRGLGASLKNNWHEFNGFKLEKGLVVGLNCSFEFWAKNGIELVKQHPIKKMAIKLAFNNKWDDTYSSYKNITFQDEQVDEVYREVIKIQGIMRCDLNAACLLWARREAGFWGRCKACNGIGGLHPRSAFRIPCNNCQGTGWVSEFFK